MWAIADEITDEKLIAAKAQDILDTFDIENGGTIEKVCDMAKYVVAFEQWVKDVQLGFVASHHDGFAQGIAGKLDSMLIPASSMRIKRGTACAVEGDIKVAMAMSIIKTISGRGQLSEMYSMHCRPANLLAMTYVHEMDGVNVLPWMLCGTKAIGEATAEKMKTARLVGVVDARHLRRV